MKFIAFMTSSTFRNEIQPLEGATRSNDPPYLWFIEINTLEELLALCKKYPLIVENHEGPKGAGTGLPSITVYDDYIA